MRTIWYKNCFNLKNPKKTKKTGFLAIKNPKTRVPKNPGFWVMGFGFFQPCCSVQGWQKTQKS